MYVAYQNKGLKYTFVQTDCQRKETGQDSSTGSGHHWNLPVFMDYITEACTSLKIFFSALPYFPPIQHIYNSMLYSATWFHQFYSHVLIVVISPNIVINLIFSCISVFFNHVYPDKWS
jgi:hypothetical protein